MLTPHAPFYQPGSAHKVSVMLRHLRELVLDRLQPLNWGTLWDLGPQSTFLDIGSGYGKVVLHFRLLARMRISEGVECVNSRTQIANKALEALERECENPSSKPTKTKGADRENSLTAQRKAKGAQLVEKHKTCAGDQVCAGVKWLPQSNFSGVKFTYADATKQEKLCYTHIYVVRRVP